MAPIHVKPEDTYDYIICGGGTAGCVLAGILAEDSNVSILVLEAGQDSTDMESAIMPGAWSSNFDCEKDWNIVTGSMPSIDNRKVKVSRGKFLGGCSGVNGTLMIRGTKQDYDDWGLEGWSGEEVFRCMAKAETFHEKDWFKADTSFHGTNGPLHTAPHELAPISHLVKESMIEHGLPWHEDMFSTGQTPHGCGNVVRTIHEGIRSLSANFVTKTYQRHNTTINTHVTVDRVIMTSDSGELTAKGVLVTSEDGAQRTYHARREVIISAGAYCSPTILLRSGIGPKATLDEHNIPCQVDLPGVGQNLMDHVLVFIFYECLKEGLTHDSLVYHSPSAVSTAYGLWKDSKTGIMSRFPFGTFAFARLDDRLRDSELWNTAPREPGRDPMNQASSQPHIEIWNTELYGGPKQYTDFPIGQKHAFAICPLLFGQRSRGNVTIRSADPNENPVVDHNYLADPLDMLVMTEACRYANEIVVTGSATKDIIKGSWPEDLTHHAYTKREEWEPYIRQHATTCYHASGTCKMGPSDSPTAVLDARLRVRGVKGLRVCDVSVIPELNNGHTQMVAYAVGERGAEIIREDWSS